MAAMRSLFFAALALAALGIQAPAASAAGETSVEIVRDGEANTVFRWSSDACEGWDIPDAPARAFRAADGVVRLFASNHANRPMVGTDLGNMKRDCAGAYEGSRADDPSLFDDKAWLSSFYTPDGINVFALMHHEFQGNYRPLLCPSKKYLRCWRNSVTFAMSRDGGRTFVAPTPPTHLVATSPRKYDVDFGRHVGYFAPTNILERDGFYYALFSASTYGPQKYGVCVVRTDRLRDPSSWRAWDGRDFTVRFVDPYRETVVDEARHVCDPVGRGRLLTPLSGVVRHAPTGLYLAISNCSTRSEDGLSL